MWRRLRRRSMTPSKPLMYPEQFGLVLFSAIALAIGLGTLIALLVR